MTGRALGAREEGARPTVERYREFLAGKAQRGSPTGFEPTWLPEALFGFQRHLVEWAVRQGRGAIYADCGLGKTLIELVWAENVVRHTNRPVLDLTPLAVAAQTLREAEKFGVDCRRAEDGGGGARVVVTNYERLHKLDWRDYAGVICDESSAIKAFDGKRRAAVTEFLRRVPYRLLATATPSPNDWTELGTSSEALGELGLQDMLTRFFKNEQNTIDLRGKWRGFGAPRAFENPRWRLKGHADGAFWRWVCSWARACRRPSDLGFPDDGFILPPLIEREHVVEARSTRPGMLFSLPARGIREEREERRRTLAERCERVAQIVDHREPAVVWCHLNAEGDLLEKLIPGARQIAGRMPDEAKEETYEAFSSGQLRVVVLKPKIGAWGLNWQHCAHVVEFASHSYEQHYQAVRRCWRFGQSRPVIVDLVATEGEAGSRQNLKRKTEAADRMFTELVANMNEAERVDRLRRFSRKTEVPTWLQTR